MHYHSCALPATAKGIWDSENKVECNKMLKLNMTNFIDWQSKHNISCCRALQTIMNLSFAHCTLFKANSALAVHLGRVQLGAKFALH